MQDLSTRVTAYRIFLKKFVFCDFPSLLLQILLLSNSASLCFSFENSNDFRVRVVFFLYDPPSGDEECKLGLHKVTYFSCNFSSSFVPSTRNQRKPAPKLQNFISHLKI